jgi:hypothetical protein
MFIVPAQTQWTLVKDWALRIKGSYLIYPCKQVTETKSKAQPTYGCMWLHWLFHLPSAMWPSCFNSLSFISLLCYSLPLSCCQNISLSVCFLLPPPFLLHYSLLWCLDSPRVKEYPLDLEYFDSMITCADVFLSIIVSIIVLIECSTRGARQGNINHDPRIRPIVPIRVLNPPKAENHSPNRSLGSHPLQVWTGTRARFLILSVTSFMTFSSSSICK